VLIVFEGHDGVGKTTICSKVYNGLIQRDYRVLWLKNPDSIFDHLRKSIEKNDVEISFRFFLMANLYSSILFEQNKNIYDIVLMERYIYSTIVCHESRGYKFTKRVMDLFAYHDLGFLINIDESLRKKRLLMKDDAKIHDKKSLDNELIKKANKIYSRFNLIEIDNSKSVDIAVKEIIIHIIRKITNDM
jgi:thymidylate kinase